MTEDRQNDAAEGSGTPGPQAAHGDDWSQVTEALNALGESIAHATQAAAGSDENRRRLRELSEGLAVLATRVGESVATAAARPEAQEAQRAVLRAAETVREVGETTAETVREVAGSASAHLQPRVLDALQTANEKFRRAAEQWEKAEKKATEAVPAGNAPVQAGPTFPALAAPVPAAPAPVTVSPTEAAPTAAAPAAPLAPDTSAVPGQLSLEGGEQSITDWLFPEQAPAPSAAPASSTEAGTADAGAPTPQAIAPDKLEAVRIAHERFLAERRIAEAAAAASLEAAHPEPTEAEKPVSSVPPADDTRPPW